MSGPDCRLIRIETGNASVRTTNSVRARCACGWRGSWLTTKAAAQRQHWLHRHGAEEAEPLSIRKALEALRAEGLVR